MQQTITIATGETFQISTGQRVYIDLGDSLRSGGDFEGQITDITEDLIAIDGHPVLTSRIIYFESL